MSSLSKRAAPGGPGGAALAVWFPRAVTLASPPGKDGGDNRAPGHSERYTVDGCRRALEVRGRPSAPREPEHRGEVRRHGGHVARRADAPEEGQARARGQREMGRGRPRGRPRGPGEAAPHRQADLRQARRPEAGGVPGGLPQGREASKRAAPLRRCAPPAPKTFGGHDAADRSWGGADF